MKLIIDIDDDVRIAISRMGLLRIPNEMQKKVDKAIQHGVPLDNLRTEITNVLPKAKFQTGKTSVDVQMMIPQEKVLQIIDKAETR